MTTAGNIRNTLHNTRARTHSQRSHTAQAIWCNTDNVLGFLHNHNYPPPPLPLSLPLSLSLSCAIPSPARPTAGAASVPPRLRASSHLMTSARVRRDAARLLQASASASQGLLRELGRAGGSCAGSGQRAGSQASGKAVGRGRLSCGR